MAQFVEAPTKTFVASGALGQYLRVKDNGSGKLALAGASDIDLGVMEHATFAEDEPATVRLQTAEGTCKMVASEALTAYATVYAAAGGKIAATGTVVEGIVLQDASGNNSVVEVMRLPNADVSATITGTNAATFEADADLDKPRMAIGSQTAGTGDFKAVLRPPSTLTADRVFTLEGDAAATLVNKAGAQTLTDKTLTSPIHDGLARQSHTVTPVAAAGSTVADAGQLGSTNITHITSDGATKGVKLPTVAAGDWGIVINNSGTAAELYAASGGTVNGGSADASVVIPASKGVYWVATGADTVIAFDLTALATAS